MYKYSLTLTTKKDKSYFLEFTAFDELEAKEIAEEIFNKNIYKRYILARVEERFITGEQI